MPQKVISKIEGEELKQSDLIQVDPAPCNAVSFEKTFGEMRHKYTKWKGKKFYYGIELED